MLTGVLSLWFFMTGLSLAFLIYDLYFHTPTPHLMKIGWLLCVLYLGPIGLFIYLISCRMPMPGAHDVFISSMWKQAVGSTVHCLAGDATGIVLAAIVVYFFSASPLTEAIVEYIAGFAFGLFIFQALFMKDMLGGYVEALKKTVFAEWLSMNMIMGSMIPAIMIWRVFDPVAADPLTLSFWGSMALAATLGGFAAYPVNYWLVSRGLKHGMISVTTASSDEAQKMESHGKQGAKGGHDGGHKPMPVTKGDKWFQTILSLVYFIIGFGIALAVSY